MGKQAQEEDGRVFPTYLDLSVYIRECGGKNHRLPSFKTYKTDYLL